MLFLSYFKTRDIHRNIATRKIRIFSCRIILTNGKHVNFVNLKNEDKEIFSLVEKELNRQKQGIELIASENFAAEDVM